MDITYGILHYNPSNNSEADDAFVKAVESLSINRSKRFLSEVYIIDQGNTSNQIKLGQRLAITHGFNFISLYSNLGISRGINWIANVARGEYISLVTSDTEFTPSLDEVLVTNLTENSNIMMICPASENSDYEYQRQNYQEGGVLPVIAQELTIQFWPRETFEKIGYFDEKWKACYENIDFALRCFISGGYAAISHDIYCPHNYHMCIRSGARNQTYDGYIKMPNGFNQEMLVPLWNNKWPGVERLINITGPIPSDYNQTLKLMQQIYSHNIYLHYKQKVGY